MSTVDEIRSKISKLKSDNDSKDKLIESLRSGKGVKDQRVVLELDQTRLASTIGGVFDDFKGVVSDKFTVLEDIARAIEKNKVVFPDISFPESMRVSNFPDVPDISPKLDQIKTAIQSLPKTEISHDPKDPIAVRLSDGEKFYEAITQVINQAQGGSSIPTVASSSNPGVRGVPILNADGTPLTAGDGSIVDGANTTIKASVLDYASSNPLAVRLTDTAGDYVSVAAGTQYTEDAAAAANPVGNALIVVREDARAGSLTTTDGDNVALRGNNLGELYVKHTDSIAITSATLATAAKQDTLLTELQLKADLTETQPVSLATVPSHAVTNAGVFAVQENGAALTALQNIDTDTGTILTSNAAIQTAVELIDDTVFVAGTATYTEATSKGQLMLGVRRDADTTLANTTNEFVPFQVDANGYLKVEVFSGQTIPVSFTGSTDVATQTTLASVLTSVQLIDNAISGAGFNITQFNGAAVPIGAGASATALRVETAASSPDVTSLGIMDDWDNTASDGASVSGDVAHDGVDAGEPVKIGGKATDVGATLTVANNDRTNAAFLRNGIQLVLGGAHDTITKNLQITDADGAQTDTAIVTVAAGTAIVVTKVSVTADNANTVDVSCRIGFGTANTPAVDAAGIVLFHPGIAAGSGVIEGTGAGIIGIGATNEDLRVTCADPVTGSISIIVTYFTILIG